MNYASRLGLVHFMRRDPNGIRRDPYCGARGIVLLTWVRCYLLAGSDGSRGTAMSWVMLIAWVRCMIGSSRGPTGSALSLERSCVPRLGLVHDTDGVRRDPR